MRQANILTAKRALRHQPEEPIDSDPQIARASRPINHSLLHGRPLQDSNRYTFKTRYVHGNIILPHIDNTIRGRMKAVERMAKSLQLMCKDTASGFLYLARSGFTLIGVAIVGCALALAQYPEIQDLGESRLAEWVRERQDALTSMVSIDNHHANAADPADLPKQQSLLAFWLAKKYGVAPEPLSALVAQAYAIGSSHKVDPLLILAVMGVESGFNPFAQSPVGAQGLMQVMTKIHSDKYERFGGKLAAFDPATNLRVGVLVLQDCIKRGGSVEDGLRAYVGATNLEGDGGYVDKVMAEYARLGAVAEGRKVPFNMGPNLPASHEGATPAVAAVATESADSP